MKNIFIIMVILFAILFAGCNGKNDSTTKTDNQTKPPIVKNDSKTNQNGGGSNQTNANTTTLKNYLVPDSNRCSGIKGGWKCTIDDNLNLTSNQTKNKFSELEKACVDKGGRWRCYGFCINSYPRFCYFPLEDSGKTCTNSEQCQGKCIIVDNSCKDNCIGKCSDYVENSCDDYIEVVDGKPLYYGSMCD